MDQVLAIVGSARHCGNTAAAIHSLRQSLGLNGVQIIDLLSRRIQPYAYGRRWAEDDFAAIVEQMLGYQHIIFATPVYWYAMSGLVKIFFDRMTDLLDSAEGRRMGRALAGRSMWLLATGTDERLPNGFHEPFALTAAYFSMRWRGAYYVPVRKDAPTVEQDFEPVNSLTAALAKAI